MSERAYAVLALIIFLALFVLAATFDTQVMMGL